MSSARRTDPELPARGSRVSLMPTRAPVRVAVGTLADWVPSPTGLGVSASVHLPSRAADALDGADVWLSARTSRAHCLVVLSALAALRPSGRLGLTGVADLVHETRRAGPRARLRGGVTLTLPGAPVPERLWTGGLVDLSRSGCRVRMDGRVAVGAGSPVRLDLRLSDGRMLRAAGSVLRTDAPLSELVVEFADLAPADLRRLDFEVLSALDAPLPA
jgi:hypothetical protein